MSSDGLILVSSEIHPIKSNLREIVEIELPVEEIADQLDLCDLPDEVVCQWQDTKFEIYDNVDETDSIDEIMDARASLIISDTQYINVPRIPFPILLSVDLEYLRGILRTIPGTSVILSYEEGVWYLASQDWSSSLIVDAARYVSMRRAKGSFGTMVSKETLEGILGALEMFESARISLGEDMPLVIVGIDLIFKLGFMIAQEIETK
jgi:hypothetical protein